MNGITFYCFYFVSMRLNGSERNSHKNVHRLHMRYEQFLRICDIQYDVHSRHGKMWCELFKLAKNLENPDWLPSGNELFAFFGIEFIGIMWSKYTWNDSFLVWLYSSEFQIEVKIQSIHDKRKPANYGHYNTTYHSNSFTSHPMSIKLIMANWFAQGSQSAAVT